MARISRTILRSTEPARRAIATLALTVLLTLAASEAHASIAFVKNIGTNTGNNVSSITITLAAGVSVAPGDSIIVSFVGEDLSGTYTATDSAGNTYSQNASGAKSGTVRTVILSAHNVKALASGNTITVTFPATASSRTTLVLPLISAAATLNAMPASTMRATTSRVRQRT